MGYQLLTGASAGQEQEANRALSPTTGFANSIFIVARLVDQIMKTREYIYYQVKRKKIKSYTC